MNKVMTAVILLAVPACAPVATNPPRLEVGFAPKQVSYYPLEAGLLNVYLEAGERTDSPTLKRENLGRTMIDGIGYSQVRFYGRSSDELHYYLEDDEGIKLAREDKGNTVITYSPPILVFPAEALEVGLSWSGETDAHIASSEEQPSAHIEYTYTVVDERRVQITVDQVNKAEPTWVDAFVLAEEQRLSEAGTAQVFQGSYWFTPYLGEVRTRSGAFLIGTNAR